MKIKNVGDKSAIWWLDKAIKCEPCGREVVLELEDKGHSALAFTPGRVDYRCEVCGSVTSITDNYKQVLLTEAAPQPESTIVESKADETTVQVPPPNLSAPTGARVGNPPVTSGWSNPFAGTSWAGKPATSLGR